MNRLYASISGFTGIQSISLNQSHGSATDTAIITCGGLSKDIGDSISIDLGYTTDHAVLFTGYIKSIERSIPNNTYNVTANDMMIRAIDYYVAPDNPEDSFKRHNITLEALVGEVLAMAGLTNYDYQTTYFTIATGETPAEVKLASAYDYCRSMADVVAWNVWADKYGQIHYRNRKPYVMHGTSGQPGDIADTHIAGITINNTSTYNLLSFNYKKDDKNLRNKVIVWGDTGIYAEAHASSPYLPAGFYKSIVFSNSIIATTALAQDTANYNLQLFNRLTYSASATVIGSPKLEARKTIAVNESRTGISEDMYIYSCGHNWSRNGYICELDLRL
jgi:hypothetical protein